MKEKISLFQGRSRTITSFLNNLDINTHVIAEYQKIGEKGLTLYSDWHNTMKDEEKFKALSPIEQQAMHENMRSYQETLTNLDQEIRYLTSTKHSIALQDCMAFITSVNILFDKSVDLLDGPDGKFKFTTLKYVKEKGWDKIKYKDKIYNLATELDLLVVDFEEYINHEMQHVLTLNPTPGTIPLFALSHAIYVSLVQSLAWLNTEFERIESEGMPKVREFKLPEIQVPKIPEEAKEQPKAKMEIVK